MARIHDYEQNGDKILKVDTKSIEPIICDGFIFPMHSKYVFELKKVYTEEPERQINGQINYFPPKFFVPYFTIGWDILSVDKFTNIMNYIARDELIVEYYDTFSGTYKKDKFYAQQPTYSGIICQKGEYEYIQGLEIVFAGTLGSRDNFTVQFDANGGVSIADGLPNITGINGEEWIVPNGADYYTYAGKKFDGWSTTKGGTATYFSGQIRALSTSLQLYAVWSNVEEYQVSLSYGIGDKYTLDGANYYVVSEYTSVKVPTSNKILPALPTNIKVFKNDTEELLGIKNGVEKPVYTFNGWNMLANGKGTYKTTGDQWTVSGNGSLYAILKPDTYTFKFVTNIDGLLVDDMQIEYGQSTQLPKLSQSGKTFNGYYTDENFTTKYVNSDWLDKPQDVTLYAKWS
jgi:uncharacterized repeat protein (TIGR02543 family)